MGLLLKAVKKRAEKGKRTASGLFRKALKISEEQQSEQPEKGMDPIK